MSNVDDLEEQSHQRKRGQQSQQSQQQQIQEQEAAKPKDQRLYEAKMKYNEGMGGDMPDRIGKFAIRSAALIGVGAVGFEVVRQTRPIKSTNDNWFKQWDEMTKEGKDPRVDKNGTVPNFLEKGGRMVAIYDSRSKRLEREDMRGDRPESERGVGVVSPNRQLDQSWVENSSLNDPRFDAKPQQEAALRVHSNDAKTANREQAQIFDKPAGEKAMGALGKFGQKVNEFYGIDPKAIDQERAREAVNQQRQGQNPMGPTLESP